MKNVLKIDKTFFSNERSYVLNVGIYYNLNGFSNVTNKISDIGTYNPDKYVLGNVTKPNTKTFIDYNNKIKKHKSNNTKININNIKNNKEIYAYVSNIMTPTIEAEVKPITEILKENNVINKNDDIIYLNGWCFFNNGKVIAHNFGDDINFSFLTEITGKIHKKYNNEFDTNYLMIGGIFTDKYINDFTEVWGSGMLGHLILYKKPNKIYAVRGPKTRDICLLSGIDCPEIYGDPALLIPYYYYPYIMKKYKLGIIPHHSHINSNILNKFKDNENIKIINFTKYNDWKDIIKEIIECEFIVSESLHGLIISETYRIPNIWISLGNNIGLNLKYDDFFLSINKPLYDSYLVTSETTYEDLLKLNDNYNSIFEIDLLQLVDVCPIKLKNLNLYNQIKPYTGKVLLCCIGKMENNYIREFVEYYKAIGFDNICLYDNNDIEGEHFEDVIGDYINSGFVILKDWRGKELALIPSYTDCYNIYKDEYDWIAYFDIDEFLDLDCNNIKEFLSQDMYNDRGINTIRICWKLFTDSDILKVEDNNYSIKRFTEYLLLTTKYTASTKIIIKTVLDNIEFNSPHGILYNSKYADKIISVNTKGLLCRNSIFLSNNETTWENARLNHYRFKTIEEYVMNKMVRRWPTSYLNGGKNGLNLNMFFRFNKKTLEKVNYANYLLDKYNIERNE